MANFNFHDLTGQRFGRLVAVRRVPSKRSRWLCDCDCGGHREASADALKRGATKSCGCLHDESARRNIERAWAHPGRGNLRHGRAHTPEWNVWCDIRRRCGNPRSPAFQYYGGRGVHVCRRWLDSFEDFLADMGQRPSPQHTIERKDNDGDYCPENCCWATRKEQANNRRSNVRLTAHGETHTLAEWCERLGLERAELRRRLRHLPVEEALTT